MSEQKTGFTPDAVKTPSVPTGKKIDSQNYTRVKDLHESGMSYRQIAEMTGNTRDSVRHVVRNLRQANEVGEGGDKLKHQRRRELIAQLRREGKTRKEIQDVTGLDRGSVQGYLAQIYNEDETLRERPKRRTKEQMESLQERTQKLKEAGFSDKAIAHIISYDRT